jgi:small GTP-binding protein
LSKLTGTESEVAAYEFTTLTCIPGTIHYRGARIQLLDMPGIIEGAKDGKGRGRQVIGTARTCDLILIVLDASKPMTHKRIIERELEGFGIRLNKKRPNVVYTRKDKGGIMFRSTMEQKFLDDSTVKAICSEYRIHNAEFQVRQPNVTVDELIDIILGKVCYIPCLYVLNKIDAISIEELELLDRVPHYVPVSAAQLWGFDDLLERMWQYLGMIRVYTKPKGQIPDYNEPVILPMEKRSVEDFCNKIHRTLAKEIKYAWVWGSSVRHQPQRSGKDHLLEDEDVVQLVK